MSTSLVQKRFINSDTAGGIQCVLCLNRDEFAASYIQCRLQFMKKYSQGNGMRPLNYKLNWERLSNLHQSVWRFLFSLAQRRAFSTQMKKSEKGTFILRHSIES